MDLPKEVQVLVESVEKLPGVAACFCSPKPLSGLGVRELSLPGELGELPQAVIRRTDGGRENEVMLQTEIIFDRSAEAWVSLEFLAWWTKDWGRSGHDIQMRPVALPPKGFQIQLGRTVKFCIEYFLLEPGDSYDKTLKIAQDMGVSIEENYRGYQECFQNPASFTGDVENL